MSDKLFNDQWAVILGGSSGLGLASALKLARHGMNLVIVHRDRRNDLQAFVEQIEDIKKTGVQVKAFNLDALKPETLETVFDELEVGSVKVLLHSIAKGSVKSMTMPEDPISREDFNITIHAMALSLYDWSRAMIDRNLFANNARILAFTSEGNSRVWPYYAAISTAKVALEALIRNMAVEFAQYGITSNAIQAGVTKTTSFNLIPGSEKIAALTAKRNPFQRITTPEDVAGVVYLLCRDEADWINGTIVKADGGESLK